MRITCLASGSSGNAWLVCAGDVGVIVDCGLSTRRLTGELHELGVNPARVQAVFLSHEHSDHVGSALTFSRRYRVPIVANAGTLRALGTVLPKLAETMPTGKTTKIGPLFVSSFALPHDGCDTVGYFLQCEEHSICLATDLGEAPDHLIEYLRISDLMILEANHDVDRLVNGPYPWHLKQRILGANGHLSNADSADAVVQAAAGNPRWLWLAHLSETNNTPQLALRTVKERLRQEGISSIDVAVTKRDRRSLAWDSDTAYSQGKFDL